MNTITQLLPQIKIFKSYSEWSLQREVNAFLITPEARKASVNYQVAPCGMITEYTAMVTYYAVIKQSGPEVDAEIKRRNLRFTLEEGRCRRLVEDAEKMMRNIDGC